MALDAAQVRTGIQAHTLESFARLRPGGVNTYLDRLIAEAVMRYSRDVPLVIGTTQAAVPAAGYTLPLPTKWVEGLSDLVAVWYPADQTNDAPPNFLPPDEFAVMTDATGASVIRSLSLRFATGNNYALIHTARHTLKDIDAEAATTIPRGDEEMFVTLASVLCLRALAADAAAETDSTIQAESAAHRDKAQRYLALSKEMMKDYAEWVDHENTVGQAFVDVRQFQSAALFRRVIWDGFNSPTLDRFIPFLQGG